MVDGGATNSKGPALFGNTRAQNKRGVSAKTRITQEIQRSLLPPRGAARLTVTQSDNKVQARG
jgi:hypothetical protein